MTPHHVSDALLGQPPHQQQQQHQQPPQQQQQQQHSTADSLLGQAVHSSQQDSYLISQGQGQLSDPTLSAIQNSLMTRQLQTATDPTAENTMTIGNPGEHTILQGIQLQVSQNNFRNTKPSPIR